MAGLLRNRSIAYQRIPAPAGETPEQASTVYRDGAAPYPEMPVPATAYVTSSTRLRSTDEVPPSPVPQWTNAAFVSRGNRRNGYLATAGSRIRRAVTPQVYESPDSSKFQPDLVGPQVDYVLNACLYRAGYPAASVMNGGLRNQALSTRVDQLVTRTSGGPGAATMLPAPRFRKVQTIPRYATMPQQYPTQSAQG